MRCARLGPQLQLTGLSSSDIELGGETLQCAQVELEENFPRHIAIGLTGNGRIWWDTVF